MTDTINSTYETVVGLEIHIQISSKTKAFCRDANESEAHPNTHISAISLGYPGTLPRMNTMHIEKALLLGLAFDATINNKNYFDRKNYFYPDLAKGYQITQNNAPYCTGGQIQYISNKEVKSVRLHHIHMEEDAGKSSHSDESPFSYIDYNRAGVPLLEVVTEPDFRSGQEVSDFLTELQRVVQYLGISTANMELGEFRCDCNVSVRPKGTTLLGERCEIKNMNSKKNAKDAIEYEAMRQIQLLQDGMAIEKASLQYNPIKGVTKPMRKKESENDYRYFPDPDLPPIVFSDIYVKRLKAKMVTLPYQRIVDTIEKYNISWLEAEAIHNSIESSSFFELGIETIENTKEWIDLYTQKILAYANDHAIHPKDIASTDQWLHVIQYIETKKAPKSAIYSILLPTWLTNPNLSIEQLAIEAGIEISDDQSFLSELITTMLEKNGEKVKEYKKGKKGLIGYFTGQVMQMSNGKADPKIVQSKIEEALK